jgi:hypothetical protein
MMMIQTNKKGGALKRFPFLIGTVFGIWGVYLVIHFAGHTGVTDFISIVIGLGLMAVGVLSTLMFIKGLAVKHNHHGGGQNPTA